MTDLFCPYCGRTAELKDSAVIYCGTSYGMAWVCSGFPECDAYVGCHRGTETPLGRLADKDLRFWKKRAHSLFDPLWKKHTRHDRTRREQMYGWLANQLGISRGDCHIGMFDVETCVRVVELCRERSESKEKRA